MKKNNINKIFTQEIFAFPLLIAFEIPLEGQEYSITSP